ncbi:hypothetical protein BDB00DRAFT_815798 [Zychaea mexicana]|uniref:uncharacterized protein n=1 Tax=Zychaea mexicana TaxID=64656 RepID=UPI0022FE63C4|nr:uncharacterized protein BDB00DRAFT_815798 [Zychaea mexicana]KAI9495083.1 hypothetical protein BDB00DRAFT_815798 [Zychaea mexicana]
MSGENPLFHCLDRLHLKDDQQLQDRAEYFQRQLAVNVPAKIFDKGPNCRTVAAIHMAFESLSRSGWDNSLAAQLAGCPKRAYENTISVVRKTLQLQPTVTFESLGVTFGCTTMIPHVQKLWTSFSTAYVSKMGEAQRRTAQDELNQPAWKGAVFYSCAKAFGERIAKSKLQEMCASNPTEFNRYLKAVSDVSDMELKELKKGSTVASRPRRKRKGETEDDDGDKEEKEREQQDNAENGPPTKRPRRGPTAATKAKETESTSKKREKAAKSSNKKADPVLPSRDEKKHVPVSGIVSLINRQDYRDTKRYRDYMEWSKSLKTRLEST